MQIGVVVPEKVSFLGLKTVGPARKSLFWVSTKFLLRKEKIKMSKKIIALVLALVMVAAVLVSCADPKDPGNDDPAATPVDPYAGKDHGEISEDLYNKVLGEFDEYYKKAKEAKTVSERFALMAIAEAKMLESGVMLPSSANGGNYAISRVAPYTATSVLWGNDSDRFYSCVIVKEDPLTPAVRDEMKAKWATFNTGAEYLAWAKTYLTGKGYTLADTYTFGYSSDPETWDALATSNAADSEAIVNTFDGLYEYDARNNQVPALAESYTVSADGLKYTFKIRQGVNWVDYQGKVLEPVTAHSFVAGFQHMLDAQGGLEYLVDGVIVNAGEYIAGTETDFSKVGVKAVDDYTLEYTLVAPTSYFTTMLGYNCFAPMSKLLFEQKGGVFGAEAFATASATDAYTYGTSHENIAYCGPYLVTAAIAKQTLVFELNETYWNKANVQLKKIAWQFVSGDIATESYDKMKDGTFAGAGLNEDAVAKAKDDGWFAQYAYVSSTDATSFPVFMNVYRAQYGNFNDETVAPSTLTELQKVRANLAMQNKDFRMALCTALDRAVYNATTVGDELKLTSLVNSYTPGNFVKLEEEVTVEINGTAKTYPAGTYYGQIMQDQIDADGVKVKVWDPTQDGGIGASSGYDGWYNVEYSRERLAAAITELAKLNVEISAENPLVLEIPYYDVSPVYTNRANALKQSIEASSEGKIEIRLVQCGGENALNWYNATYYPKAGDDMNFNLMDNSGWGPDYGDPQTYLDTMFMNGYMLKCIGLY